MLRTLVQNVSVLRVVEKGGGGRRQHEDSNITIRVSDRHGRGVAFAADNGKVWFALRPPAGASEKPPVAINRDALLAGSAPIDASGGQ